MSTENAADRRSSANDGYAVPRMLTFDFECHRCRTPLRIPLRTEWDNPVYVMEMERQHRLLKEQLGQMGSDLMELAHECLDAGVKPEILRRADELREMIDEWKRLLGDD